MSLLLDGLRVLRQDTLCVIAFSAAILWGSAVILGLLTRSGLTGCDGADFLSLALGGWIVPVLILAIVGFAAEVLGPPYSDVLVVSVLLVVSTGVSLWWNWPKDRRRAVGSIGPLLILAAIVFGGIGLRLAFVANISLPLYFDSPQHFRIIQALVEIVSGASGPEALTPMFSRYYHLGFHLVLAQVAWLAHVGPGDLMLVSGQIVLATLPASLFFMVRRESASTVAGLLAAVLGAMGWYMPSYALNWGKYPALFSFGAVLFTLNAAYLSGRAHLTPSNSRRLRVIAWGGGCVAVLIHTRSIVVLAMVLLAWAIAGWWQATSGLRRPLVLAIGVVVLLAEVLLVYANGVLNPLLDPYLRGGVWITGMVILLSVPLFRKCPRLAMAALLTLVLLLAGLFIPGPEVAFGTLLDRPLVEMILFAPLAVVGGAGLVASARMIRHHIELAPRIAAVAVSSLVLAHAFLNYSFYPSSCCSLVDKDDSLALAWITTNLPQRARVVVPSAPLAVFPSPYVPQSAETDAGAWILPLTGRAVSDLPYSSDFGTSETLRLICQRGATDIYAGTRETSFSHASLRDRPEWYSLVLDLPGAQVYHVRSCPAN